MSTPTPSANPATAVFGEIFVAAQLEEAVMLLLREWFQTYLRYTESLMGLPVGELPQPRVYTNRNDFETIEGDHMPLCVVMSPGLVDEPYTRESGIYTARWALGVGVAIAADTETKANLFSRIYAAAARGIMMQHQDIGGLAIRVDWLDENYSDLPDIDNQLQQYRAAGVYFAVEVENVVSKWHGPSEPDKDPYEGLGQVEDVIIDVGKIGLDDEI